MWCFALSSLMSGDSRSVSASGQCIAVVNVTVYSASTLSTRVCWVDLGHAE